MTNYYFFKYTFLSLCCWIFCSRVSSKTVFVINSIFPVNSFFTYTFVHSGTLFSHVYRPWTSKDRCIAVLMFFLWCCWDVGAAATRLLSSNKPQVDRGINVWTLKNITVVDGDIQWCTQMCKIIMFKYEDTPAQRHRSYRASDLPVRCWVYPKRVYFLSGDFLNCCHYINWIR